MVWKLLYMYIFNNNNWIDRRQATRSSRQPTGRYRTVKHKNINGLYLHFGEIRWDFFNLFNRTNFRIRTSPGSGGALDTLGITNRHSINATDFGVIDRTFSAREMQVGLKVSF